jgi:signal recognition particle subunit SRP54
MFESLSDRLNGVFQKLRGRGRLDENNIREGLREVRLALLEADVNYKVVKDFVDKVAERCVGQEVLQSLTPAQQVVKVVNEELIELLGGETQGLDLRGHPPAVIMVVGLQGSGKTTTTAKLATYLRKEKMHPFLVPADVYRPAAVEQLQTLAKQLDMPCFDTQPGMTPVEIAAAAVEEARLKSYSPVILDTAGRLHVDEVLMEELKAIKKRVKPGEILLAADAMTGQDAVTVAEAFNQALDITGVVLTKMEGDARGGAALSVKSVTGKSIKFVGVGEKPDDLELFHPDRTAGRILGMGDVLTLIEKAQTTIDADEAAALAKKMEKAEFDLEDFVTQMRRLKKLGSLDGIMKLIPGMGGIRKKLGDAAIPEKEFNRVEAMINSMTKKERRRPEIIDKSRRNRIAKGSGTAQQDVAQLLKNFDSMRKMMKQMGGGKRGLGGMAGGMPQMPPMPGMGGGGAPGSGGGSKALKKKVKRKKRRR